MVHILRMFGCEVPLRYPRWVVLPEGCAYALSRMGDAAYKGCAVLDFHGEPPKQRLAALTSPRRGAGGTLPTTTVYEEELKAMSAKLTKPPALAGRRNQPSPRSSDPPASPLTKTSPPSELQRSKQFVLQSNRRPTLLRNNIQCRAALCQAMLVAPCPRERALVLPPPWPEMTI